MMKLPKISGGFLNVTQKCNLACRYCFVKQQPLEISYQVAKDAIDFYARNALDNLEVPQVTFFGGEPMLRYEDIIKPIIEYIRSRYGDFSLSITTNGTLLNEERLKFLKENDVAVMVSIDGNRETQDFNRPLHNGKGSFDLIDVKLFRKYYPEAPLRSTLDPATVDKVFENYLWGESMGYKTESLIINVFAKWEKKHYEILEKELDKVVAHIKEARKQKKPYMEFTEINKMQGKYRLLEQIAGTNYFRNENQMMPACGTCGLGGDKFGSIGSSGNIYSCQEMTENKDCDEFIIGNIYEDFDDDKRLTLANRFNTKNVECENKGRCKACMLNKVCEGGCTINNYFKNGSLEVASEPWCRYQEMLLVKYEDLEVCD